MTICRITRLSSATRIFTGTPSFVTRGSVLGNRQGGKSSLHGDGERLAAPEDVDTDDVLRVADGRCLADLGKAEAGGAGEGGLDVAAHHVGDLTEGVGDVLVVENLRRGQAQQG